MLERLIVGNWKMHKTVAETKEHIRLLKPLVSNASAGVWLAVPYTSLAAAHQAAGNSSIQIGAQNMGDLEEGALTGEISALMILETEASFVILGHSERRRIFKESNDMINRKVKLALNSGLKVILCIGETQEERKVNQTATVLKSQLVQCLEGVPSEQMAQIAIAYEPVWAIGNHHPATKENVDEIHVLCKNFIAKSWNLPAEQVRMLYGGSVDPKNSKDFLQLPVVDGLLVGGASLDVPVFAEIVHQAEIYQ
jgi:triosephosphate isomerase